MRQKLIVENLKAFEHLEIELAPLTILLGANSTGKSTVIQALRLANKVAKLIEIEKRKRGEFSASGALIDDMDFYRLLNRKAETKEFVLKFPCQKCKDESAQLEIKFVPDSAIWSFSENFEDFEGQKLLAILSDTYYLSPVRLPVAYQKVVDIKTLPSWIGSRGGQLIDFVVMEMLEAVAEERQDHVLAKFNRFLQKFDIPMRYKLELKRDKAGGTTQASILVIENGEAVNLADAGFGLTQLANVAIGVLGVSENGDKPSLILLEEPETHLHPRFIAFLTDLFVHSATLGNFVVVETHSEHLLIRTRRRVAEGLIKPEDVAVYFFERKGDNFTVRSIKIDENGQLSDDFPADFFAQDYLDIVKISEAVRRRMQNADDDG